jgi:hypothetical protein
MVDASRAGLAPAHDLRETLKAAFRIVDRDEERSLAVAERFIEALVVVSRPVSAESRPA